MSFYKYVPPLVANTTSAKDVKGVCGMDAGSGLISMDLHQDSLQAVARKLTQITGKNVILCTRIVGSDRRRISGRVTFRKCAGEDDFCQ